MQFGDDQGTLTNSSYCISDKSGLGVFVYFVDKKVLSGYEYMWILEDVCVYMCMEVQYVYLQCVKYISLDSRHTLLNMTPNLLSCIPNIL